jgi:uncharacterized protein YbjT (DUF2867 family)
MTRVLVAGATGHLGRRIVPELRRRGYDVRILVRDASSLGTPLQRHVESVVNGDLTRPATIAGICKDVDVVLSCAGAPKTLGRARDRRSFHDVDFVGNGNLLDEAERAEVGKFVYVSVLYSGLSAHTAYIAAHEEFVRRLTTSRLEHTVMRPTGYFSFFDEMLRQAARGRLPVIGDGSARTNPIHEQDLAEACVAAIAQSEREIELGGPAIYSREEIARLAFEALGTPARLVRLPALALRAAGLVTRPFNPRLAALLEFGAVVSQVDAIAPRRGTRDLLWYFKTRSTAVQAELRHAAGVPG